MPWIWILAVPAIAWAVACSGGATDPLDDFSTSPEPVLGSWITVTTAGDSLDAVIERGPGFLFGEFEFAQSGVGFDLPFDQASWNGSAIQFTTADIFGAGADRIPWTALLVPAGEGSPAILRLFPRIGGGVPFSVEYVRDASAP